MKPFILFLSCIAFLVGSLPQAEAYLDPETGTFITLDPSGFVDGPNRYSYVGNNPWSKCDPYGLEAVAFLRYEEDYKRALELQKKGDALWRKDVHIVFFPDEDGQSHPVFEGLKLGGFNGKYAGKLYDQGTPFIGTRAAWYFGDEQHSKIVNNWFASGRTLELLTIGASTAVGSRIPGPKSVAEVTATQLLARSAGMPVAQAWKLTKIPYGGNDLSHMAIAMRYAENYLKGSNAAVVEYRAADGTLKYFSTFSQRGLGHAERLLAKELEAQGIKPEMVTRFYTELEPCSVPGGYCKDFLQKTFPHAEVTFSFEYGATQLSRGAGIDAMKAAVKAIDIAPPPAPPGMHQ